ncbi:hypothetical protein PG996_005145 [Apiospora saccharicola]|uniref:Uncharacterized protein n=1 Tax=Apiospora saccharicola TaxID=335842 RepID=A0ABR1VLR7_9PEZI
MEPFRAPPPLTTLPPGYRSDRPQHPGLYMLLIWTFFITSILVIFLILSLVLHIEERNYARRQQLLLKRFRDAFPPSPTPLRAEELYRDLERDPLIPNFYEDSDTSEEDEETYNKHSGGGGGGGYGATGSHGPFVPAQIHEDDDTDDHCLYRAAGPVPPPVFSPRTTNNSYMSSIDTVAELAGQGGRVVAAAKPRSPSVHEGTEPSSGTDSGMAWEHVESVAGNGSGLAEEAAAAAEDAVAAEVATDGLAGLGPSQIPQEAASTSSSPETPGVLDGHEVMAKIKKAVHWHSSLKGQSSSSSSGCSSPKSSQHNGLAEGLRRRGNQE